MQDTTEFRELTESCDSAHTYGSGAVELMLNKYDGNQNFDGVCTSVYACYCMYILLTFLCD